MVSTRFLTRGRITDKQARKTKMDQVVMDWSQKYQYKLMFSSIYFLLYSHLLV